MKIHNIDKQKQEKEETAQLGYQLSLLPTLPNNDAVEAGEKMAPKESRSTDEGVEDLERLGRVRRSDCWSPMFFVEVLQEKLGDWMALNGQLLRRISWLASVLIYHVVLIFALRHNFQKATNLLWLTLLCWLFLLHKRLLAPWLRRSKKVDQWRKAFSQWSRPLWEHWALKTVFYCLAFSIPLLFVLWDTRGSPRRLSGLLGLAFFLLFMCLCSHKPTKVCWRPILWGFLLQFLFGLLVLKWEWGAQRFIDLSDLAIAFLDFTKNGTDFTYGFLSSPPNICGMEPVIAFQVIQVIIYIGAVVSVLYFYGIIQAVLKRMAMLMQLTMNTTATESLNACACVLLGNAESPMLIRPYIEKMTSSELNAIMTTGFACIAGAVFAAYISFGACPRYLLSAAVMSAPGSLACAKLLYPETEKSHLKDVKDLELPPSKENNAMECISNGSIISVHLVTAVVANLISFMALMALLNGIVGYTGSLLGFPDWNLETFFGYCFFPVAYLIGITENFDETFVVARLIGVKMVVNDFIAYKRLGDVLKEGLLSPRSAMIATYALCSFSDFIAAGIQMAVLSEMAPSKKQIISKLVFRALLGGSISCFMSASIAGILIDEPVLCKSKTSFNSRCFDINEHQTFMEQAILGNFSFSANSSMTREEL